MPLTKRMSRSPTIRLSQAPGLGPHTGDGRRATCDVIAQPPGQEFRRFPYVYSGPSWSNGARPAGGYAGVVSGWESLAVRGLAAVGERVEVAIGSRDEIPGRWANGESC